MSCRTWNQESNRTGFALHKGNYKIKNIDIKATAITVLESYTLSYRLYRKQVLYVYPASGSGAADDTTMSAGLFIRCRFMATGNWASV